MKIVSEFDILLESFYLEELLLPLNLDTTLKDPAKDASFSSLVKNVQVKISSHVFCDIFA